MKDTHPVLNRCLVVSSSNGLEEDREVVLSLGGVERQKHNEV